MFRHSPTRNQRSKGFRLKHLLQICLLVAVCFWLIYQVKHSHDKRKRFDENNAKSSVNVEDNSVLVNLGRKDLIPQEKGRFEDSESHDAVVEEDENEEGNLEQDKREEKSREEAEHEEDTNEEDKTEEEESEENDRNEEEATETEQEHEEETGEEDRNHNETGEEDKHEEETNEKHNHEEENGAEHEEQEQEEIQSEEKDEGRGDEDNEVNQHESEKANTDVEGEEESIDEEKDKEDPIEETKEKNDEGKDTLTKNDPSIENHVHDEGSRSTREAREEQYKGDDASSAVTHDAQNTSTENENGSSGSQLNSLDHESKGNSTEENKNATVVKFAEVETAGDGTSALVQSNSSLDFIPGLESNDQQGSINKTDISGSSVKNETEIIISDPSHAHDAIEGDITTTDGSNIQTVSLNQATNFTVTLQNTQVNSNFSNSNATKTVEGNPEESTDTSTKSEFDNSKNVEGSNVLAESKDSSDSVVLEETANEVKNENPDNIKETDGTYENSDSSTTEHTEEVQYDSTDTSDPSVTMDDKENRIDLDTLPEIKTEGSNSEEVAED